MKNSNLFVWGFRIAILPYLGVFVEGHSEKSQDITSVTIVGLGFGVRVEMTCSAVAHRGKREAGIAQGKRRNDQGR